MAVLFRPNHAIIGGFRPAFRRHLSSCPILRADYTHTVIGGGVVGLAVSRLLAARPDTSTLLLERHPAAGTETSSRNSEVIHAGLYYPADSLKTRLCISGKQKLYDLCKKHNLPHSNTGKWIVAQDDAQLRELEGMVSHAKEIGVDVQWVSETERSARRRDEGVRATAGALNSPTTGIIDSHALMGFLQEDLTERGGDVALSSTITRIEPIAGGTGGYTLTVRTGGSGSNSPEAAGSEDTTITTETLINAAGLAAVAVSNMLLPPERHLQAYYAKGTYFSYTGPGARPTTLVYPAPQPGAGGLGTHLTLDLAGAMRFGPDVEWIDTPDAPGAYAPSEERLPAALDAIQSYLPDIDRSKVRIDYCGIRPKLGKQGAVGKGKGFQDFVIRKEDGFPGYINLVGIESPGLTSSLAIAEEVDKLLYR